MKYRVLRIGNEYHPQRWHESRAFSHLSGWKAFTREVEYGPEGGYETDVISFSSPDEAIKYIERVIKESDTTQEVIKEWL